MVAICIRIVRGPAIILVILHALNGNIADTMIINIEHSVLIAAFIRNPWFSNIPL
jgi:hypothetical protein